MKPSENHKFTKSISNCCLETFVSVSLCVPVLLSVSGILLFSLSKEVAALFRLLFV